MVGFVFFFVMIVVGKCAEAMWQLGLGAGAGVESYPERPSDPDCIHYLRTGFCGYGARCRFNHPRDRAAVIRVCFY